MLERLLGHDDLVRLADVLHQGVRRHMPGTDRSFAALLPQPLLRQALTADRFLKARNRAFRQGRALPLEMLIARDGERWHLRPESLQSLCAQGLSLVLDNIDAMVPGIAAINAAIERRWRAESWTNAYWSHGRESAFTPHADSHDVLILQLSGIKRWRCWGMRTPHPIHHRAYGPAELPEPAWEGLMQPGDMLFIPRGDIHAATLAEPSSLHLTLSLKRPQPDDLLDVLRRHVQQDERGRKDLPEDGIADLRSWLAEEMSALDMPALLAGLDRKRSPYRPLNLGVIVGADTLLSPTLRRDITPVPLPGGGHRIEMEDRRIDFSKSEWSVLALTLAAESMTLTELLEARPADDTMAAINSLVARSLLFALAPAEWQSQPVEADG